MAREIDEIHRAGPNRKPGPRCLYCDKRLIEFRQPQPDGSLQCWYGWDKDGFFCGLRCGYRWAVRQLRLQQRQTA